MMPGQEADHLLSEQKLQLDALCLPGVQDAGAAGGVLVPAAYALIGGSSSLRAFVDDRRTVTPDGLSPPRAQVAGGREVTGLCMAGNEGAGPGARAPGHGTSRSGLRSPPDHGAAVFTGVSCRRGPPRRPWPSPSRVHTPPFLVTHWSRSRRDCEVGPATASKAAVAVATRRSRAIAASRSAAMRGVDLRSHGRVGLGVAGGEAVDVAVAQLVATLEQLLGQPGRDRHVDRRRRNVRARPPIASRTAKASR